MLAGQRRGAPEQGSSQGGCGTSSLQHEKTMVVSAEPKLMDSVNVLTGSHTL